MSPDRRERRHSEAIGARLPDCLLPMQKTFFTSVLQGNMMIPSSEVVERAVKTQLDYEPLTPLDDEEALHVYQDFVKVSLPMYDMTQWQGLSGDVYYSPPFTPDNAANLYDQISHHFYIGQGVPARINGQPTLPLTPKQKEALFTDPAVYERSRIHDGNNNIYSIRSNGTRHLTADHNLQEFASGDHYGYNSEAEFTSLLALVRSAQGKAADAPLKGLDIGGSTGLGAHDAEKTDPGLSMQNLTVTPEMAFWPLKGGTVLLPAERMPANFAGNFDLIISNYAFTYMRYPEIAMENGLRALSLGGIMNIEFEFGTNQRPGMNLTGMIGRIDQQFRHMEELAAQGIINYLPVFGRRDAHQKWKEDKSKASGQVFLQKTGNY